MNILQNGTRCYIVYLLFVPAECIYPILLQNVSILALVQGVCSYPVLLHCVVILESYTLLQVVASQIMDSGLHTQQI